jgi:hypothetical protein
MYQRLGFYLILLLAISCEEKNKTEEKNQLPNQIVLIFDHPPINHKYTFESGIYSVNGGKFEVSFIDDQGQLQKMALAYDQEDTIIIKSAKEAGRSWSCLQGLGYALLFVSKWRLGIIPIRRAKTTCLHSQQISL